MKCNAYARASCKHGLGQMSRENGARRVAPGVNRKRAQQVLAPNQVKNVQQFWPASLLPFPSPTAVRIMHRSKALLCTYFGPIPCRMSYRVIPCLIPYHVILDTLQKCERNSSRRVETAG